MLVVVGEALVDLVVTPDGGITPALGGAPYNTARAAARLGVHTTFVGGLSDDRFGRQLRERLVADGVAAPLAPTEAPTTLALAELDESASASYRFYLDGTSAPQLDADALADGVPPLGAGDLVFTGGLGLVLEPMATTVAGWLASLDPAVTVVVDVNCRPAVVRDREAYVGRVDAVARHAAVVKVSDDDLAYLRPGLDVVDAARSLVDAGAGHVVVTAGADPTLVVSSDRSVEVPVPAPPAVVVDTIGAGDTFGGGVVAHLAETTGEGRGERPGGESGVATDDLVAAVRLGQAAAAIVVTRRGADPPTRDELDAVAR